MKLIIDIPEEIFELIINDKSELKGLAKAVKNGIPLTKIRDAIEREADYQDTDVNTDVAKGMYMALDIIDKYTKGDKE